MRLHLVHAGGTAKHLKSLGFPEIIEKFGTFVVIERKTGQNFTVELGRFALIL